MNIIERLERLFVTKAHSSLDKLEDKIQCLEYELNKRIDAYDKANEEFLKIQGEKRKLISDTEAINSVIDKLEKAAKKAIEDGNDNLARRSFILMEENKKRLSAYKSNIELLDGIEEKLQHQLDIFSCNIKETKLKIDTLKIKNDFSNSIKNISSQLKCGLDLSYSEIDKISDEIEKNYYTAEVKSENIDQNYNDGNDLNNLVLQSQFEDFKKLVLEKG